MSRFIVTTGSNFKPLSYDELIKPLRASAEAHKAIQDEADSLAMQAGAIGSMLDDSSPKFKALYDNYMDNLTSLSEDLYNNGLNPKSSQMLSAVRRMYGRDITKINAAITQKSEAVKKYDEDLQKDKTLITDRDPRTLSLDEWYDNPYAGKYNAYSGNMLTAKASAIGENLKRDIRENGDAWRSILGGQYFERNEFTGFHANEVNQAIDNIISGKEPSTERIKLLQSIMQNVYDSSGMSAWASPEQRAQAFSYIGEGVYSAIGENKNTIQQDRSYVSPYQWATLAAKNAKSGSGSGSNGSQGALGPVSVQPRGNNLSGNLSKEMKEKREALTQLELINELKKSDGLRDQNGALTDTAVNAVNALLKNKYFKELSGGRDKFLGETDLDPIIDNLRKEVENAATNDHDFMFYMDEAAARNLASNTFKLNIGQLHGKNGDSVAASVAKYSDGSAVSAKNLMSVLDSENISIGFDAKRGKITVQRKGGDDSETRGKYDDRIIYLDPQYALTGTSGLVNAGAILTAFEASLPEDAPLAEVMKLENQIAMMANVDQTFDLRNLAGILKESYQSMVVNGSASQRAVFNALVEALALGLYDSSNTAWSPNKYREGWGAKTGGEYNIDDDYSDLYFDE